MRCSSMPTAWRSASAAHHIFTLNIGELAPGITLRQGWSVADASVGGQRVIFISTHPESDFAG